MCAESTETRNQTVAKAFRGETQGKGKEKGEATWMETAKLNLENWKLKTEKYLNNV